LCTTGHGTAFTLKRRRHAVFLLRLSRLLTQKTLVAIATSRTFLYAEVAVRAVEKRNTSITARALGLCLTRATGLASTRSTTGIDCSAAIGRAIWARARVEGLKGIAAAKRSGALAVLAGLTVLTVTVDGTSAGARRSGRVATAAIIATACAQRKDQG